MNILRKKRPNFSIYLKKKLTSLAYDEILILHRSPFFVCVCELAFSFFFFLRPFEKAVFPITETYSYGVLSLGKSAFTYDISQRIYNSHYGNGGRQCLLLTII